MKKGRFLTRALLAAVIAVAGFGCAASGSGAGDNAEALTGTWAGQFLETQQGIGSLTGSLTVVGSGSSLSGTAVIGKDNYTLNGTVSGSTISITLTDTVNTAYKITATGTVSGNIASGSWSDNTAAPNTAGGTFSVTKQ